MKIFNIQRYSLHDGPGTRTTVFMKGCPLRCAWCHNPESQSPQLECGFDRRRCLGTDQCNACMTVCPVSLSPLECTGCGKCAQVCPTGAREQIGREIQPRELLAIVLRDEILYRGIGGNTWNTERTENTEEIFNSENTANVNSTLNIDNTNDTGDIYYTHNVNNTLSINNTQDIDCAQNARFAKSNRSSGNGGTGGVTFSGGEPLWQATELREVLELCREYAIHTAVDTCGEATWSEAMGVFQRTDLVLYDLKSMDEPRHRAWTGTSNERILANFRELVAMAARRGTPEIWVRIPVIPTFNADMESLGAIAAFVARCIEELPARDRVRARGVLKRVSLLPYHRLGAEKVRRLCGRSGDEPRLLEDLDPFHIKSCERTPTPDGRRSYRRQTADTISCGLGITPPTFEQMEGFARIFRGEGWRVE